MPKPKETKLERKKKRKPTSARWRSSTRPGGGRWRTRPSRRPTAPLSTRIVLDGHIESIRNQKSTLRREETTTTTTTTTTGLHGWKMCSKRPVPAIDLIDVVSKRISQKLNLEEIHQIQKFNDHCELLIEIPQVTLNTIPKKCSSIDLVDVGSKRI